MISKDDNYTLQILGLVGSETIAAFVRQFNSCWCSTSIWSRFRCYCLRGSYPVIYIYKRNLICAELFGAVLQMVSIQII